jgi:hypothetical protein
MEADCELTISNCELETEMGAVSGVGIGSYSGNADIKLDVCKIMTKSEGKNITGIGTVTGQRAGITATEMSLSGTMNANLGCMLGAMNGKTTFSIEEASMQGKTAGQEVYMFGGKSEDTEVSICHADVAIEVRTKDGSAIRAPREKLSVVYARYEETFNDVTTVVGG